MKLFALFLLFSTACPAVSVSFSNMPPNQRYMTFALTRYWEWLEKKLPSTLTLDPLAKLLLKQVDHWNVKGTPQYSQFLVSFSVDQEGLVQQRLRIFIPSNLRNHPLILAQKLPKYFSPWFFLKDVEAQICFLGKFPQSPESNLDRVCGQKIHGQEIFSREMTTTWPNPFPYNQTWEIRTIKDGKVTEIFYSAESTHPQGVPKNLYPILNAHGTDGLFPFDKYSIDAHGKMTIYFP